MINIMKMELRKFTEIIVLFTELLDKTVFDFSELSQLHLHYVDHKVCFVQSHDLAKSSLFQNFAVLFNSEKIVASLSLIINKFLGTGLFSTAVDTHHELS